jgi:hypothetical protein
MRVPGLKHLKLYARWWRSRFVNGGLILGYHRIVEKTQDSYAISVTPTTLSLSNSKRLTNMHTSCHLPKLVLGLFTNGQFATPSGGHYLRRWLR